LGESFATATPLGAAPLLRASCFLSSMSSKGENRSTLNVR
jgi:hypothetical protein